MVQRQLQYINLASPPGKVNHFNPIYSQLYTGDRFSPLNLIVMGGAF
jgi:hypothetical protein